MSKEQITLPSKERLNELFEFRENGEVVRKENMRGRKFNISLKGRRIIVDKKVYNRAKLIYYYFIGIYPDEIYYKDLNVNNYSVSNLTTTKPKHKVDKVLLDKLFIFDKETGEVYWKIDYKMNNKGELVGILNNTGYYSVKILGKTYGLHQIIYLYYKGYIPKYTDHINRIRTDNRIENLREVTQQENTFNRSGVKGYSYHKRDKTYQAEITYNGQRIHLGSYNTPEEAREAYLQAKEKYHKIKER